MVKAAPAGSRTHWIVTAIWVTGFALMLPVAFGRAGDIAVDSFHDLTVAMRLSRGEGLYREIAYLYGPVGAFLVWFWTGVFGLTVRAYLVLCAILAGAELYLVDRLARRYMAPAGRVFLLFGVMAVFTFHSELFSRLMPYSLSAFVAELGFLFFLERWAASREDIGSPEAVRLAAGVAAGLLLHTKLEFGLVALVAAGLDFLLDRFAVAEVRSGRYRPLLSGWLSGFALGFPLVYSLGGDLPSYLSNIDPRSFLMSAPGKKLAEIAGGATSAGRLAAILGFAGISAVMLLQVASAVWFASERSLRTGLLLIAASAAAILFRGQIIPWLMYTPLAGVVLFLALAAAALVPSVRRDQLAATKLLLVLAAGGALLRSPGALAPGLFGTFYLLPALVIGVALSGEWARWLELKDPRRSAQALAVGFFVYSLWGFVANLHRFQVKEFAPSSALMPFATDGSRARAIGETLAFLSERMKPGDPLAVMPQEPVVYFALRAKPVFPDHNFIAHVVRGDSMAGLAARLEKERPRFAVVSNRPYPEGGLGPFGTDYAQEVQAVLDRDYRVAGRFGQRSTPPGVTVTGLLGDPYYAITVFERKE